MKVIGITGGIATGKSVAGRLLLERGHAVVDTDDVARSIVAPGQPALREIINAFGASLVDANGILQRQQLADIVFNDAAARQQLESILHPRIRDQWEAMVKKWAGEGRKAAFVLIPLLFETNAASEFDAIICLGCSPATQLQRMQERGWSGGHITKRLNAQWPLEKKLTLSNYVIWTDTSVEVHGAQLNLILKKILSSATAD